MSAMQFREYVWPQNPSTLEEKWERKPRYGLNENGIRDFLGMTSLQHTIRGTGVFVGSQAHEQYKTLCRELENRWSGKLILPHGEQVRVYLLELAMGADSRADYIPYRFLFQECNELDEIPE